MFSVFYKKISCFLGLAILTVWAVKATDGQNQKFLVHLNRQVLIGGSILKYTAYLTQESAPNVPKGSKTFYFEITNAQNKPIVTWKSQTYTNQLSGEYHIPDNLPQGMYQLHVFTNELRKNSGNGSFSSPLIIQEIHEEPMHQMTIYTTSSRNSYEDFAKNEIVGMEFSISVVSDTLSMDVKKGTTVLLSLPAEIKTAQLSVAITEVSPFDSLLNRTWSYGRSTTDNPEYFNFLPEQGFTALAGKVTDTLGLPLINQVVYVSCKSEVVFFNYAITDGDGNFCFALDSTWNNKDVLLQLSSAYTGNGNVQWHLDQKNSIRNFSDTTSHFVGGYQFEYINQLQKRELVHRIFAPDSLVADSNVVIDFTENLFFQPKYVVYPSDYETLKDFKELADNILPAVRFKKENDIYKMGIVNDNQVIFENVLVCLNGNPVTELSTIARLSSKDVERVEIFNSVLMYGELTFNGVVSIFTHAKEFNTQQYSINGTAYQNQFYSNRIVAHATSNSQPTVLPDIYWNPSVILTPDQPFSIKLNQIDIGHNYVISVRGFAQTGGFIWIDKPINF
ncbi:MAG: hypothetical protein A2W84_19125 [Bacteroidetes bacterium GWC2_40_13]|nr:MAG: hypothetical protein A2W84_19125 [Bacteroidetes bacterium GWC2_40_13]